MALPEGLTEDDAETLMAAVSVLSNMAQNSSQILSLSMYPMLKVFLLSWCFCCNVL